ncbi:MAG: glycosyltransferase [Pirellulaceae bacterium]
MNQPDISIVVCTRNRAALLRGALASLYDLATEDEFSYEIVVVDNGSTDETGRAIAEAADHARHPVRGVCEPEAGIVAARNRGIREARGRWIAFFDDDQLADWHWLAELYRGAIEKNCRVVGGAVQLALPADCRRELAAPVRMLLGEAMGGDLPQRYGGRLTPGCGNLMIQRCVFDQIGTFETAIDGRGEDTDLFERMQRARIDAWYLPTAVIHHLTPPERLERDYLLNLAMRMGRGIGMRQRKALGTIRFTSAWLLKGFRILAIDYPRLMWAGIRGNAEATLGRRCQLLISQAFLSGGCVATPSPQDATTNVAPESPPVANAPSPTTTPADATPAAEPLTAGEYVIRGVEPTAVMDFPVYTIGSPAPTIPFQS